MSQPPPPSHSGHISRHFAKKSGKWGMDIKNAFLQASDFCREVFLRGPVKWDTKGGRRTRKLQSPANGLDGAPAAIHNTLKTVFVAAR